MASSLSVTTRQLLASFDIRLKKGLGQHFLTDDASLSRIVEAAGLDKDDLVLEIGTGIGTLTKELCKRSGLVISNEYDKKLLPAANEYLKENKNLEIVMGDFLKLDLDDLFSKYRKYKNKKVVANLPYYITSPIIAKLLENKSYFSSMVLTIQREVAHRIVSGPGTKEYGSFTIFVNYHCKPTIVSYIPKTSFLPQPEVGSAILRLEVLKKPPVEVKNEKLFFDIVHAAFMQRRKILKNAIENAHIKELDNLDISNALDAAGIDARRRGETLSIEEFAKLANSFK